MTDAEVRSIHARYVAGESIREMSSGWRSHGFNSVASMENSIYNAFGRLGLATKSGRGRRKNSPGGSSNVERPVFDHTNITPEGRRWLRAEIDRRRRERLARTARIDDSIERTSRDTRVKASQRPSPFTDYEVFAISRSVSDGLTVDEIAESCWRDKGFKSAWHCGSAIKALVSRVAA